MKKEFESRRIDLVLLFFHQLFTTNKKNRSTIFDGIKKIAKEKLSASPLSTLVGKLNLDTEMSMDKLFDQINGLIDFHVFTYIVDKIFESRVHQEPELISIGLILGSSVLQSFRLVNSFIFQINTGGIWIVHVSGIGS